MKEPVGTRYVPEYDLFKLTVAVMLAVILFILLLHQKDVKYEELEKQVTQAALLPTATAQAALPTATPSPASEEPEVSPATEIPETVTPLPKETPSEEITVDETPSPTEDGPTVSVDCPSNPTRISVGDTVKVLDWLNFRVGPGLNFPIEVTNKPGTEMEVIDGPTCTVWPEEPPRAYLWWKVKMDDDREGWSAEAPLNFPNYFLEPIK